MRFYAMRDVESLGTSELAGARANVSRPVEFYLAHHSNANTKATTVEDQMHNRISTHCILEGGKYCILVR